MPRLSSFLVLLLVGFLAAQDVSQPGRRPTVAILSFTGAGTSDKDLAAATSRFETELQGTDSFSIVERRNIDRILGEQGFQQSGACDTTGCSVEIGRLLSVQRIFTGELVRNGKVWSLTVKETDVSTGQTGFSHVLDIEGGIEEVLRGGCPEMALIASGRKKPENDHTVLVAKGGSLWPWLLGGAAVVGGGAIAVALIMDSQNSSDTPGASATSKTTVELQW